MIKRSHRSKTHNYRELCNTMVLSIHDQEILGLSLTEKFGFLTFSLIELIQQDRNRKK